MDDAVQVGARTLRRLLDCQVALVADPAGFWPAFEVANCLNPRLQPALTAAHLSQLVARLDRRVVHELAEPLGTRLTVFWLGETLAVIGPYTTQTLSPGAAEELLGRLRIPGVHLQQYQLYRSRFAVADSEYVMRGATSLLELDGRAVTDLGYQRVDAAASPLTAGADDPVHSASYDVVAQRYASERDFLDAVREGDERAALAALAAMSGTPMPQGSYLNQPYLGSTILRIMTRVAAHEAGLPPVTIDAVSQGYAQRLHRSGHVPDSRRTTEAIAAMVTEFCRAIRRYRQRPYSLLVRQAVDDIELHLSHHVSAADLSARLHVSQAQLARRFKAETGRTISEYVALERSTRAARLLTTTDQPVSDIAAYVGYLDANYFVKVFRRVHGVTPTTYRAQSGGRWSAPDPAPRP